MGLFRCQKESNSCTVKLSEEWYYGQVWSKSPQLRPWFVQVNSLRTNSPQVRNLHSFFPRSMEHPWQVSTSTQTMHSFSKNSIVSVWQEPGYISDHVFWWRKFKPFHPLFLITNKQSSSKPARSTTPAMRNIWGIFSPSQKWCSSSWKYGPVAEAQSGQSENCLVSHGRGGRLIEAIRPTRPDKCCIHNRKKCMLGQSEPIASNIGDTKISCTPLPTQTVNFPHNLHKL